MGSKIPFPSYYTEIELMRKTRVHEMIEILKANPKYVPNRSRQPTNRGKYSHARQKTNAVLSQKNAPCGR